MTTLHEHAGTMVAFAKGAPEVILRSCTRYVTPGG
jgi:magnesium-transporting ATPase (P-type)